MKKLEKRSIVTYSICHESGHKSHGCKLRRKKKEEKTTTIANTMKVKEKRKMTRETSISDTHTKKINKATPYLLKKNHDGKVIAYKIGVEDKHWNQPIWVPKDIIINMKGPKKVWFQISLESKGLGRSWRLGSHLKIKKGSFYTSQVQESS